MKILIPVENRRIAPRFCAAKNFMIFDISYGGKINGKEIIDVSSKGDFEKAKFVKESKVDTIICLGIEQWIYHYLTGFGIRVIPGVNGNIDDILTRYIRGNMKFCPFPMYGFKIVQRGRHRRGMKGHRWFNNGHFKNRFM